MKTIILDVSNIIKESESDNQVKDAIKSIKSLKLYYNIIFIIISTSQIYYNIIIWMRDNDLCNTPIILCNSYEEKIEKIKKYNGYIIVDNNFYLLEKIDNSVKKILFNTKLEYDMINESIIKINNWTNLYDYLFSLYLNDNLIL